MKSICSTAWSLIIVAALSVCIVGQEAAQRPFAATSVPTSSRFEVIQTNSLSGSYFTFRLDRTTGRVYQLAQCPQRTYIGLGTCWKEMIVLELPKPINDAVARYQIFVQGDPGRAVMLLNTLTGQTWQHGVDGADKWTPLLETVVLPQSFEIVK